MSSTAPALLAASAGVAIGHAILPDHWVPLAVLGRARRYPLSRVARLSALAGVAHVLLSIVLGTVIIVIGLQFRSSVQGAQDTIVGCLLIVTGLGFIAVELTGHGHHHHPGESGHDHAGDPSHPPAGESPPDTSHHHAGESPPGHGHDDAADRLARQPSAGLGRWRDLAALMIPFGAAASPDLTILPVFLAAAAAGVATAVGSVVVFAAVTIGTIVGLTLAAARGGYQLKGEWLERWGNALTAAILLIIGALVLLGLI